MSIQEEIIQTAENIIKKYFHQIEKKINSDVVSTVTEIKNGKYKVNIDGTDYWLKDGIGLDLKVGTQVWVRIVNDNERYIASKK